MLWAEVTARHPISWGLRVPAGKKQGQGNEGVSSVLALGPDLSTRGRGVPGREVKARAPGAGDAVASSVCLPE